MQIIHPIKMASSRIFNSCSDGQIWVDQITPILSDPEAFIASPSIFVVPKTLSAINPEAYTPRLIGMGPYHHLRPGLYALETYKLRVAQMVLRRVIPTLKVQHLVAKLKELDSEIRASYNEYLDLPGDVLALIIAIDGLYLLGVLKQSSDVYLSLSVGLAGGRELKIEDIHGDLFMLENQIPIKLLRGIFNQSDGDHYSSSSEAELDHQDIGTGEETAGKKHQDMETGEEIHQDVKSGEEIQQDVESGDEKHQDVESVHQDMESGEEIQQDIESGEEILLSPSILVAFCKERCPLELDEQRASYFAGNRNHLLDFMYFSIVDFHGLEFPGPQMVLCCAQIIVNAAKDAEEIVDCFAPIFAALPYGEQIKGLLQRILQIIQGMPWDRIFLLCRKPNEDHAKSKSKDVKIPSASQLSSVGVEINLTPKIRGIQFDEKGPKPTLYLPFITLDVTSKVVLRNLVAYEASKALPGNKCELALYAFLMSGIIRAAEDVELLKAKGVVSVKGGLSNGEIADIFRGMCKPSTQPKRKSKLEETIETVNKFYNGKWKVRACKFARASWRVLKTVFTVLVISAICLKLFCNAFDCPRISWKSPSADLGLALQIQ